MIEYEEGTKECLGGGGHRALYSDFGTDVSRADRLNPFCRVHAREKVQQSRLAKKALDDDDRAKASAPDDKKSELAIEREKAKRLREQEISDQLAAYQRQEVREVSSESVFSGLGFFMRKPKPAGRGWTNPVGVCCTSR